jgi:hypothetical protein
VEPNQAVLEVTVNPQEAMALLSHLKASMVLSQATVNNLDNTVKDNTAHPPALQDTTVRPNPSLKPVKGSTDPSHSRTRNTLLHLVRLPTVVSRKRLRTVSSPGRVNTASSRAKARASMVNNPDNMVSSRDKDRDNTVSKRGRASMVSSQVKASTASSLGRDSTASSPDKDKDNTASNPVNMVNPPLLPQVEVV